MQAFQSDWPWFRGNLHLHTTRSDGRASPEEAFALYAAQGYDFVALTDHGKPSIGDESPHFLQLAGVELDMEQNAQAYHIVGVGMSQPIEEPMRDPQLRNPQALIDKIRAAGGRAILAHPAWSLMQAGSIAALKGLSAAEVFNSVSRAPWNGDRADSGNLLDIVSAQGQLLPFVASDDTHFYTGEQFGGWIWLNAPELSRAAFMQAFDEGRFFASQGPRFEQITLEDGRLSVQCSPVARAVFYSNRFYSPHRVCDRSDTAYEYEVQHGERFIRVEIIDQQNRRAWSNPISLV